MALDNIPKKLTLFSADMQDVLAGAEKKDPTKLGWETCDLMWLLMRLRQEVDELGYAMGSMYVSRSAVRKEAIDVANFAMMIWDRYREKSR